MTGAGNQQERLFIEAIPTELGSFLSGFALGEASFMIVCRRRGTAAGRWRISATFNVSQHDRAPLELFRDTLRCGTIRRGGSGGGYWEVNSLPVIRQRIVPFFDRFPLVGSKAEDYRRFRSAVELLSQSVLSDPDYTQVLALREGMNRGGNRRHSMERILRDYTPSLPLEQGTG